MESARYDVFLSYSHADEKFAARLDRALAGYLPPRGVTAHRKPLRVYRDMSEASSSRLGDELAARLRESRKLIVICSPAARASRWVATEIELFTGGSRSDHVIPVLASGAPSAEAPDAAFPEPLLAALGDEPWAADFRREYAHDRPLRRNRAAWYHLLASIYDVERDAVEERERRRLRLQVFAAAISIAVAVAVAGYVASLRYVRQSLELAPRAIEAGRTDIEEGIGIAVAAVEASPTPESVAVLRALLRQRWNAMRAGDERTEMSASRNGESVVVASPFGTAALYDLRLRNEARLCTAGEVILLRHSDDGKYVIGVAQRRANAERVVSGFIARRRDDPTYVLHVWDARTGQHLGSDSTRVADRRAHAKFAPDGSAFLLIDTTRGELRRLPSGKLVAPIDRDEFGVRTLPFEGRVTVSASAVAFSPDGRHFVTTGSSSWHDKDSALTIRSTATGKALWRYRPPRAVEFAAYDRDGKRIIAYGDPNSTSVGDFFILDLGANDLPASAAHAAIEAVAFDFLLFGGTRIDWSALHEVLQAQIYARHPMHSEGYSFAMAAVSANGAVAAGTLDKIPWPDADPRKPARVVVIFSPRDTSTYARLPDLPAEARGVRLTDDGSSIAIDGLDCTSAPCRTLFGVWSTAERRRLWQIDLPSPLSDVRFSADGSRVFLQLDDKRLAAYESATGRLISAISQPRPNAGGIQLLASDRGGRYAVVRSAHAMYEWDLDRATVRGEQNLHRTDAARHKIDGDLLATGSAEELLLLAKRPSTDCSAAR